MTTLIDHPKSSGTRTQLQEMGLASFAGVGVVSSLLTLVVGFSPSTAFAKPPLPQACTSSSCGSFVTYGTVASQINGNTLNLTQSTSKAILNWASFNIANGYTVNFAQPSSTASVLNKIWSADPSVIAGALKANGQVYLYNQNGIVFDKGAQVNVASLVASTLALAPVSGSTDPDALFKNGLLSNNSGGGNAVFETCTSSSCTTTPGAVTVNSGATITAADSGRIMLLGSAVTNNGTIHAPDGQVILGAGSEVYLAASTDPALRGLLIETNASGVSGTVTNGGTITTERGNITLAGMVVNQAGTLSATTSVSENGSIYLVAGDTSSTTDQAFVSAAATGFGHLLPTKGGTVTLESGSVTEILPDSTDTGTISEATLASSGGYTTSQIGVVGQTVAMVGNATIHAPSANVTLSAATDPANQFLNSTNVSTDGGRIYLDSGSTIDVSGLKNVEVPVTQNILSVTLESTDLADDPTLRDSFLHGTTVVVNANQGSTLFDVSAYKGNIALGINQVMTTGGTVALHTDGDLIARTGSTINVSGGSVAYQGGYAASTTKLVASNGKVYDISTAPTDLTYTGLANSFSYTDPTWGTQTTASTKTYYAGYVQGANAGSIQVWGPQLYLGSTLEGSTVTGPYQRTDSTLPLGGLLTVGCDCTNSYGSAAVAFLNSGLQSLPANFNYLDSSDTLPSVLQDVVEISPSSLTANGFSRLSIYSDGAVTLPQGVSLSLAAGGSLAIASHDLIDIAGNISAPGGAVSLKTTALANSDPSHDITIDSDAVIDTSGMWVNDSPLVTSTPGTSAVVITGGSISVAAAGDIILGNDSGLDVSGGGWINSSNSLTKGSAGKISINATYQAVGTDVPYTGAIELGTDVALLGNSLTAGGGGTLSLTSGSVTIGWQGEGTPGELLLAPTFFSNKGFGSYSITGENDLTVGSTTAGQPSVVINPVEENLVFTGNSYLQKTGTALSGFTQLEALPVTQRTAANLTLTTTSTSTSGTTTPNAGNLYVAANASIVTDPGASVTLDANTNTGSITFLGSILAPAGDITLQIGSASQTPSGFGYVATQEILIGPTSSLEAPAYALVDALDPLGYREGAVLAGGTVTLAANRGYVVTDLGSTIDVSGAATTLDIVNSKGVTPTTLVGNAGSIAIDAREGLVLQGALRGEAAQVDGVTVAGAGGGTLSIGLDLYDYVATATANNSGVSGTGAGATIYPLAARTLTLTNQTTTQLATSGTANVSQQTLMSGGFDNILLKSSDIIAVDGSVSLSTKATLTLDAPLLQAAAGASLQLTSAHVSLGNYFNQSDYFNVLTDGSGQLPVITSTRLPANPVADEILTANGRCYSQCTGTLNVNAQLIDVRGVSGWVGFSTENLTSSGDIRFDSALNYYTTAAPVGAPSRDVSTAGFRSGLLASGTLNLTGQQVYPTTYTDFSVSVGSAVNILAATDTSSTLTTPLSAGGIITINSPTINQSGVLRAPLGEITLNGTTVALESGSITSVSANGATIPYGATLNGDEWTYSPASGYTEVVSSTPEKGINLTGDSVYLQKGATVDLSGGGDLLAYEWIAGTGGSTDVLNSSSTTANHSGVSSYQYAIVPTLGSQYGPVDSQYAQQTVSTSSLQSQVGVGEVVYLSGVPGLAAGYYALLPARYALLPGAYAISIVKSNSDISLGSVTQQANGSYLVAGKLGVAGTDIVDSRTSTILVASSSVVESQSQYTLTSGNVFFSEAAAAAASSTTTLPADAGALALSATTTLALNTTIDFTPGSYSITDSSGKTTVVQGSGGNVSIQAPAIEIVDSGTTTTTAQSGVLVLDAASLNGLGANTLILGGTGRQTTAGEEITVATTQSVELANTTDALTAPEIVLAAQNAVTVDSGAQISAKGALSQAPTTLVVNGAGALLAASSGGLASIALESSTASDHIAQNSTAVLSIGSAANVAGTGSVLLYATGNTTAESDAVISAPALGLYSNRISLGDVPTGSNAPGGLNLTGQLLDTLANATALTIGSTSTIDFYGAVSLGSSSLKSIAFDAAALDGYDTTTSAANVTVQAGAITFENLSGSSLAYSNSVTPTGTGSLTLTASAAGTGETGELILGAGAKAISGFASGVSLNANGAILTQGTGASLCVPRCTSATSSPVVALSLTSAAIMAAAGSDQTLSVSGPVTISQAATTSTVSAPLGGKLVIDSGAGITQNGTIELPAGIVELHASTGDVVLGNGSVTSAAGAVKSFTVTNAVADAGQISLIADQGNVTLAQGATVDVAGATSSDGKVSGSAGSLTVSAHTGTFTYTGSIIEGGARSGELQGNFTLDVGSGLAGTGLASLTDALQSGGFTGDLDLRSRNDASVIVENTSTHPNGITASGFTLTVDQGSIDVQGEINTSGGSALNASAGAISLWAAGNLTLEQGAKLLANGTGTGPTGVNGTTLAASGGDVTLGTETGTIDLKAGSEINVTGSTSSNGGTLLLRAPVIQTASATCATPPCVGITEIASTIDGVTSANPVVVEAFNVYQMAGTSSTPATLTLMGTDQVVGTAATGASIYDALSIGTQGVLYTDAESLLANSSTIESGLLATNPNSSLNVQLRAGIEIQSKAGVQVGGTSSTGDLQVGDAGSTGQVWNLDSWNLALGAPVNVSLRTAGNLVFNASLSDGFNARANRSVQLWYFGENPSTATTVGDVDSADYRLTAGADLSSANPLEVTSQTADTVASDGSVTGTGNVVLTPGRLIRTGDGNIQIAAGGDVLIGYTSDTSDTFVPSYPLTTTAIYSAGIPTVSTPVTNVYVPAYPTEGGDVSIVATNDIRSAPGAEVPSDWLWRQGIVSSTDGSITTNTSWWVEFGYFQGIGALGGGDISLTAGGDVVDVTAAIPTTGLLAGAIGTQPSLTNLTINGGGTLIVRAGGNISSGLYEDDWGNALLSAGSGLTASATLAQELPASTTANLAFDPATDFIYPLLFLGSGEFTVNARTGAETSFVGTSTSVAESVANTGGHPNTQSAFYLYDSSSVLTIESSGGDVVLDADISGLPMAQLNSTSNQSSGLPTTYVESPFVVYPPTLNVVSLSADVEVLNSWISPVTLFPSASGNLNVLAQGYITGGTTHDLTDGFAITMLESDPSALANVLAPESSAALPQSGGQLPSTPLHQDDTQSSNIVAETGGISKSNLKFPKSANIVAGGNIADLNLIGKNLNPWDVTLVAAGGSITYSTPTAQYTNALQTNNEGINLAGPGYLEVLAGGTLNLGDSNGIVTSGSLTDSRLSSTGATVVVGAGFGSSDDGSLRLPDTSAFIDAYLTPTSSGTASTYASDLIAYMEKVEPALYASTTYQAALSGFESLTFQQQLPLLSEVLMSELAKAGKAYTSTHSTSAYTPGYTAINTLFPTKDSSGNALTYSGDIDLFFSQIKTEAGGDIDLLAPGGSVIVGVPNPPASLTAIKTQHSPTVPAAANLGLLVLASGAIEGFADDSFEVNQSRILTLQGGDIILWASNGDIDAGKGAKSASGASPPVIQTDSQGNVFVNPIGDVSGSGIGQLITGPNQTAGEVDLIAPKGVVNAGDAGIRVAGNLNIAAVQVIGASNITVGGTATGVPVSEAGALSGALSGANSLGDAAKSTVDALGQNLSSAAGLQQLSESLQPTFIVVKMFCLGLDCQQR